MMAMAVATEVAANKRHGPLTRREVEVGGVKAVEGEWMSRESRVLAKQQEQQQQQGRSALR